jgi:hypothetical protein
MVDKWIVFKEVVFKSKGKRRQRDVKFIDLALEYVPDVLEIKDPDADVLIKMNIIIPEKKIILQRRIIGNEDDCENNSESNHPAAFEGIQVKLKHGAKRRNGSNT